jgi:mannose-6-phosphate isomerase-like protein (cupin superfamily)
MEAVAVSHGEIFVNDSTDTIKTADHWQPEQLIKQLPQLSQRAVEANGVASEALGQFARHAASLTFRNQSGVAELHSDFADLFYILEGRATLITGGEIISAETIAPGEVRGESVQGGKTQQLCPGEIFHIPAGLPHQMMLADGETIAYFVIKIQENG